MRRSAVGLRVGVSRIGILVRCLWVRCNLRLEISAMNDLLEGIV